MNPRGPQTSIMLIDDVTKHLTKSTITVRHWNRRVRVGSLRGSLETTHLLGLWRFSVEMSESCGKRAAQGPLKAAFHSVAT